MRSQTLMLKLGHYSVHNAAPFFHDLLVERIKYIKQKPNNLDRKSFFDSFPLESFSFLRFFRRESEFIVQPSNESPFCLCPLQIHSGQTLTRLPAALLLTVALIYQTNIHQNSGRMLHFHAKISIYQFWCKRRLRPSLGPGQTSRTQVRNQD